MPAAIADIASRPAKLCPRCGKVRFRAEFARNPARRDGMSGICKDCYNNHIPSTAAGPCTPEMVRETARVRERRERIRLAAKIRAAREERSVEAYAAALAAPYEGDNLGRLPMPWDPPCSENINLTEMMAQVRRLRCVHYDHCLDVAERLRWLSFTCNGCDAGEERPMHSMVLEAHRISASLHNRVGCR